MFIQLLKQYLSVISPYVDGFSRRYGGFHKWGYRQMDDLVDGLFHGQSY